MNTTSNPFKVFISYSHDSKTHADLVLNLADRLRLNSIDVVLDQYELAPSQGWPNWMLDEIEAARFVLMICTEQYNRRFRGQEEIGKGKGVTWEGAIVTQTLYDNQGKNSKFIPVLLNSIDEKFVPLPLRSTNIYKLDREDGYELLYRRLTDQHKTPAPALGAKIEMPLRDRGQNAGESLLPETKPNSPPVQPSQENKSNTGNSSMEFSNKSIRALLDKAFSSDDISNLCFDYFSEVYRDFTPGQIRSARIKSLVDYASERQEIPKLLTAIEKMNPNRYSHFLSNPSEYE